MGFMPDEAKTICPPNVFNRNSFWLGGCGWMTALLHNALNQRPPLKSGVHRQVLLTTIGWFLGYHLSKYETYHYAKLERDMNNYIERHPEEFARKEEKTFAEIVEPFHPVR